jgi:hypothetical protein
MGAKIINHLQRHLQVVFYFTQNSRQVLLKNRVIAKKILILHGPVF